MKATRILLLLCGLLVAGISAAAALAADASGPPPAAERLERQRRVKLLQQRKLVAKARRVLFGGTRAPSAQAPRRADPEYTMRRAGDADYVVPEALRGLSTPPPVRPHERHVPVIPERARAIAPNLPISDPAGEELGSSQNEPSLAAWGAYVLAAYNDWPSLDSLGSIQGYSWSVDAGQTFVDAGTVPAPGGYIWTSDPVISVNEKSGEFFYCGLLEDTLEELEPKNGVGVVRGTFGAASFQWGTPRIVRVENNTDHFLDKPWIAADSSSGNVYLSFTDFFPVGNLVSNTIQFVRSRDGGATWDPELTLNSTASNGAVQGSRPVVGPNGEVYVTWKEIGPLDPGSDFMRIRKSTTRGASFGSENTVTEFFDNYGTGAPGFNREKSVALPSIAVDRSRNASRGRLYVTWNESLNWYDDIPALGVTVAESEYNDFFADPDFFTIGQTLVGTFRDDNDYDSWAFQAEQDSSYVFWADTVSGSTYRLRVWCADSLTRLTYTGHLDLPDAFGNQSIMVFTAPSTGTYYLDMTNARIEGRATGSYRIVTGRVRHGAERGRDQRDVFVNTSADGISWSAPVRVNDDAPRFDNWLPEVAAATNGDVYLVWYDWRDAAASQCGGLSNVYAAHSNDAASSWTILGSITDQLSNWTYVNSNLIPNQGDYLGLYANENAVYVAWTDGRLGSPDIYGARISLVPLELQVSTSVSLAGEDVTVGWQFVVPRVVDATVYRQQEGFARVALASVASDASGRIAFTDTTAVRGNTYVYSLGIATEEGERIVGNVLITIPGIPLLVAPNPMRSFGVVSFSIPTSGEVEVMIHDVTGRRVRLLANGFRTGGAQYQASWDARDAYGRLVQPGVYLVRLTSGGKTFSKRVTVMP